MSFISPDRRTDVALVAAMAQSRGIGTGQVHLYDLVEAELEAVEAVAGPPRGITEVILPEVSTSVIGTARPIAVLASVSERRRLTDPGVATTLVENVDYRQVDDSRLARLGATWPAGGQVIIAYDPVVDQMLRYRVVCDLVKNTLDHTNVLIKEVGPLRIEYSDAYEARRQELLAQLGGDRVPGVA